MDTKALAIFVDVARLESFAAAARKHQLDPSSVSRLIAVLEKEIGARLFQRTTRKQALTEAGALYLRRLEPLLEELERATEEAHTLSRLPSGHLRLTTSVAFGQECIMPLLGEFNAQYPGIDLELLMTDSNLDLIEDRVDLALRLGPSLDSNFIGTRLMQTRYRVVASPDYLAAHPRLANPEDLAGHACILFTFPTFRTRWLFRDRARQVIEVPVKGHITISNALAIRDAARRGLGPALLADWMIDGDTCEGRLVDIFPEHRVTATSFDTGAWLLYPSRSYLPRKVRTMIDFLKSRLGP